jgi:hypothetical protein
MIKHSPIHISNDIPIGYRNRLIIYFLVLNLLKFSTNILTIEGSK